MEKLNACIETNHWVMENILIFLMHCQFDFFLCQSVYLVSLKDIAPYDYVFSYVGIHIKQ